MKFKEVNGVNVDHCSGLPPQPLVISTVVGFWTLKQAHVFWSANPDGPYSLPCATTSVCFPLLLCVKGWCGLNLPGAV